MKYLFLCLCLFLSSCSDAQSDFSEINHDSLTPVVGKGIVDDEVIELGRYDAMKSLVFENHIFNARFHYHDDPDILITSNSASFSSNVAVSYARDEIVIRDDNRNNIVVNNVRINNGGVSIMNNTVVVNSTSKVIVNGKVISSSGGDPVVVDEVPILDIYIPQSGIGRYSLYAHGSSVIDARISEGSMMASVSGAADVIVGNVIEGRFTVIGSGDLSIASISDTLDISVSGSGSAIISSGRVSQAYIKASGSGDINARIHADSADLQASGAADIYLSSADRVRERVSGAADITVR